MRIIWICALICCGCVAFKPADFKEGRLKGMVGVLEGDCMPQKDKPPCEPKPVVATVLVTKPSETFKKEYLIDLVESDARGYFELALKPDRYSVFVRYSDKVICTGFICRPQCECSPITIEEDSTTQLTLKIDMANW